MTPRKEAEMTPDFKFRLMLKMRLNTRKVEYRIGSPYWIRFTIFLLFMTIAVYGCVQGTVTSSTVSNTTHYLDDGDPTGSQVLVADDKETYDRMSSYLSQGEEAWTLFITTSPKIFKVASRTRIAVEDPGVFTTKIMILEGPHKGRTGIVSASWVK